MPWMMTYGGTTQSFADWGIDPNATLELESWACDTLQFTTPGRSIDAVPIVPYRATVIITDPDGVICLVGPVTKIPVKGSPKTEDQMYTVSSPWWWFERLVYQMTWQIMGPTGTLVPTLRSAVIVCLDPEDFTAIDLGQMAKLVMQYVLDAAAADPDGAFIPFQIGTMTPDTQIPFTAVEDLTCSQLIVSFFAWVQDAMMAFDYTTTPPTLNITQRGLGTPVTLTMGQEPLSSVDLNPRYDLVVKGVVVKYAQSNTIDGTTFSDIIVDKFPLTAVDPGFDILVQNVELLPGNISYLKQTLVTTDRPKDYDAIASTGALSTVTWNWLTGQKRSPWLKSYIVPANWPAGTAPYIQGNTNDQDLVVMLPDTDFTIRRVVTTLADNYLPTPLPAPPSTPPYPLAIPPANVLPGTGPGSAGGTDNALDYLGQELLRGSITDWMTNDQSVYSAPVDLAITIEYIGTDPVVQQWFSPGPTRVLRLNYPVMATNGSTQLYTQPSSGTPSEPAPTGLAQNQFKALSVIHYEGTLILIEKECSSLIGLTNVVNIAGGWNIGWTNMNAQVFKVTKHLKDGTTTIKLGPPVNLDAKKLTELLRASRGRIQSWQTNEAQTGVTGSNNTIAGAGDTAQAGAHTPPGGNGSAGPPNPYSGIDASEGATPMILIAPGMHNGMIATIDGTPLGGTTPPKLTLPVGTGYVYVQCDCTTDAVNDITMVDNELQSALGANTTVVPANSNPPAGGGSGTLYEPILQFVATVTMGKASVVCSPLITNSRNFAVCMGAFTQPW